LTACSPSEAPNEGASLTGQALASHQTGGEASGTVDIYMLDIGQGDAILLKVGNAYHMIDTGDVAHRDNLVAQLKKMGISKLDSVMISHPHADHLGGFLALAKNFDIGMVYDDGVAVGSSTYKTYIKTLEKKKIPHKSLVRGDRVDYGNGLIFSVLAPWKEDLETTSDADKKKHLNDFSIVGKLTFGKFSMLLTGDAEKDEEGKLIKQDNSKLFARVLKVAHHGSPYTTSKDFIRSVKPESALISVGLHNDYGHPGKATLDRLQAEGVDVYRTDTMGRIHLVTDGDSWKITTER